jgi:hypothetical protein
MTLNLTNLIGFGVRRGGYRASAVAFNGSTYYTRGGALTGVSASDQVIFSAWLNFTGTDGADQDIFTANLSNGVYIRRSSGNKMQFLLFNAASGSVTIVTFTTSSVVSTGWHHILFAKNGTTLQGYFNGVSDLAAPSVNNAGAVNWAASNWGLGSDQSGSNRLVADLADLYIAPGQYLDMSNAANRAKFIDASGKPVNLGSDGSAPTGTAPAVYVTGPASTFATNLGTGGGFTLGAGGVTDASTSPSD